LFHISDFAINNNSINQAHLVIAGEARQSPQHALAIMHSEEITTSFLLANDKVD